MTNLSDRYVTKKFSKSLFVAGELETISDGFKTISVENNRNNEIEITFDLANITHSELLKCLQSREQEPQNSILK